MVSPKVIAAADGYLKKTFLDLVGGRLLLRPVQEKHEFNPRRSEALVQSKPMRRTNLRSGKGSFAIDKPSGHGGAQSGRIATPRPRSTITAMASIPSSSNSSFGRIPALRR